MTQQDEHLTRVILRRFKSEPKHVIALFPELPGTNDPATCESYMHVGQHGAASVAITRDTTPVPWPFNERDVKRLLFELHNIGYRLLICKRFKRSDRHTRQATLDRRYEERKGDY